MIHEFETTPKCLMLNMASPVQDAELFPQTDAGSAVTINIIHRVHTYLEDVESVYSVLQTIGNSRIVMNDVARKHGTDITICQY